MIIRNIVFLFIVMVSLISTSWTLADGAVWVEKQALVPEDSGESSSLFSGNSSLDGDTALVMRPGDDENGTKSGSAYVFVRDGENWTQQAKLLPDDGAAYDMFGSSGSLDGDTVVVGAAQVYGNSTDPGSAYVFVRNGDTWTQQAKLVPSDSLEEDRFGSSVSLDGDTVAIGAYDDELMNEYYRVYVFVRSGTIWTQQAKIVSPLGSSSYLFGKSLSLDDDTLLIGEDSNFVNSTGAVYVFVRYGTTWSLQGMLEKDEYDLLYDCYAQSVALDGDTAIVGDHCSDDLWQNSGAAYVFTRTGTTWVQQAKLLPPLGLDNNQMGFSVSIRGDNVILSSLGDLQDDTHNGLVHFFERTGTTWAHHSFVQVSQDNSENHYPGASCIDGDTALLSDVSVNHDYSQMPPVTLYLGAVYIYTLEDLADGESCTDGSECESGFCVDQVCCDSACGGGSLDDCLACSVAKGAAQEGVCDELDGTACDDGDDDTFDDTCHQGDCFGDSNDDTDTDSASDPDADGSVIVPPVETRCSCEAVGGQDLPTLVSALVSLLL